jgi:hypothetical protein
MRKTSKLGPYEFTEEIFWSKFLSAGGYTDQDILWSYRRNIITANMHKELVGRLRKTENVREGP